MRNRANEPNAARMAANPTVRIAEDPTNEPNTNAAKARRTARTNPTSGDGEVRRKIVKRTQHQGPDGSEDRANEPNAGSRQSPEQNRRNEAIGNLAGLCRFC
jgi:hypothetical protein